MGTNNERIQFHLKTQPNLSVCKILTQVVKAAIDNSDTLIFNKLCAHMVWEKYVACDQVEVLHYTIDTDNGKMMRLVYEHIIDLESEKKYGIYSPATADKEIQIDIK